jgi:hypothetical protein
VSTTEQLKPGDLVVIQTKDGIYGTLPKCWVPENWESTITAADNIHLPKNSVGVVIGEIGNFYHTALYNVSWLNLGGTTLTVPGSRVEKIT